jgi:ribonucleotide monophosphatase NagD (HAD superfamily)
MESGIEKILVLTGVTERKEVDQCPCLPTRIVQSVAEIEL